MENLNLAGPTSQDFEKKVVKDVVIEIVNISRATWKEAMSFKEILTDDISKKFKKIVIDVSKCEFMDSTFLGVLVLSQKNIAKNGGEIKLVEPSSVFQALMEKTSTLKIFETHKSRELAVTSFEDQYVNNSELLLQV